jgi:sphingomyelin phosphodiesterase 2
LLRLKTPAGQIDLYATHLIANYNHLGQPGPGDRYLAHRTAQSYELVRFISSTSRNNLVVVCGDFNSPSDCLVLRIPREIIHLRDAFTDTNNSDGLTFATEDNKYSHGEHPMRMDYVLYKIAKQQKDTPGWQLVDCDVYKGFFTDSKGEKCPISDHFGVKAEFVFGKTRPKACEQALGENSKEKMSPIAKMCQTRTCPHCDNALGDRKYSSESSLTSMRCLEDIHEAINTGRRDAISRRSGHLRRSGLSFLALLLTLWSKSSYWEDNTVYFLILILTIHTILEYILAFFFVTLECSSFTELGNQIRLHLHSEKANEAVS